MKIIEKIHKIKESRLNPGEKYLYAALQGEEYMATDKPNSIFLVKDKKIIFQYDHLFGILIINKNVWDSLIKNIDQIEIRPLIIDVFRKKYGISLLSLNISISHMSSNLWSRINFYKKKWKHIQ